tara:strand:- start:602 stop:1048 length:447 start_codon:yes stop_codon:yes gene_type:complete
MTNFNMRDINYILDMMPHRYPFLMVDKVINREKKFKIQTLKNVTINEPYFNGHFPNQPIMPGVLIMESMAQSACLIILDYIDNPSNNLVYLSKVSNFRILKNVIPGDQILIDAEVINEKMNSYKFHATCIVNSEIVAKAEFIASVVSK